MKCKHKWIEQNYSYYLDYNGYRVLKITYYCNKCKKRKTKKFY